MAIYEINLVDQMILVLLWIGLIYGLYGLALAWLALTNLEWRWLIADRLRAELWGFNLRLSLAWLGLINLAVRGYRRLQGE